MATFARALHVLLLGLWFGAGVAFFGVFSPDAFGVLDTRQAAGELVAAVLAHLDLMFLVSGPLVLVTLFAGWMPLGVNLRLRAVAGVVMLALTAVSGRWLSPKMMELRQSMGGTLDDVGASDPLFVQLTNLHTASSAMLVLHVALALVLLVAAVVSTSPRRRHGIEL